MVTNDEHSLDVSRVEVAPDSDVLLTPAPYPHFTIKECLEQPNSIARALSYGARMDGTQVVLGGLDTNKELLKSVRHVLLTGCGTSKYASEYGAKIMRELECFDTVQTVDSAEVCVMRRKALDLGNRMCCMVWLAAPHQHPSPQRPGRGGISVRRDQGRPSRRQGCHGGRGDGHVGGQHRRVPHCSHDGHGGVSECGQRDGSGIYQGLYLAGMSDQ